MRRPHRPLPQLTPSEVECFWQNVDTADGPDACWLYGLRATLHPLIYYRMHTVRGTAYAAHRLAYTLTKGPIPDGLEIDHICNVKACVNPAHLEAVSHRENIVRGYERRRASDWQWDDGASRLMLPRKLINELIAGGVIRTRFWYGIRFISREDLEREHRKAMDSWRKAREAAQETAQGQE